MSKVSVLLLVFAIKKGLKIQPFITSQKNKLHIKPDVKDIAIINDVVFTLDA
jgi:hypothetical protein